MTVIMGLSTCGPELTWDHIGDVFESCGIVYVYGPTSGTLYIDLADGEVWGGRGAGEGRGGNRSPSTK